MSSIVGKDQGLFDPSKKYAFTNITTEPLESAWGGQPINIPAGETVELPQHLADKLVDELVDRIMIGAAKLDEVEFYKKNPGAALQSYHSNLGMNLGVPAARKVWEDQIVKELGPEEETPQMQIERAAIRDELLANLSAEVSSEPPPVPTSLEEFSELKNTPEEAPKKAPLKVKKIAKAKAE